jgi:hypothetical protein
MLLVAQIVCAATATSKAANNKVSTLEHSRCLCFIIVCKPNKVVVGVRLVHFKDVQLRLNSTNAKCSYYIFL